MGGDYAAKLAPIYERNAWDPKQSFEEACYDVAVVRLCHGKPKRSFFLCRLFHQFHEAVKQALRRADFLAIHFFFFQPKSSYCYS